MFVDSHCHLTFPELMDSWPAIDAAMQSAQVTQALCICTTMEEFPTVHAFVQPHAHLHCTVGVHPDYEASAEQREPTVDELVAAARMPKVVGIGETGLDYYRLNGRSLADMEWQRQRFRNHIQAARQTQRPLVVHTRSSSADTLAILREQGETGGAGCAGGVFHCFTETVEVARAALDLGFYISLSGIVTFKNAAELREVAAFTPLERLLIETDSPFLAPAPHRGKTNNPSYVPHVAAKIAEVRGLSVEQVAQATRDNYWRLFPLAKP